MQAFPIVLSSSPSSAPTVCVQVIHYATLMGKLKKEFPEGCCRAVLCYAMLCCAVLCYAVLCYAMLCYALLRYAVLCAMLCYV